MLQKITTGLAIAAIAVIAIFSLQNLDSFKVWFLFWSVDVSKIVVILGSYVLGMLTGGSLFHLMKKSLQKSKQKKSGTAAEEPST